MMNLDSQHVVCDQHMNCLLDTDLIRDVVTNGDLIRDSIVTDDFDQDVVTLSPKKDSHHDHHSTAHIIRGGHEVSSHHDTHHDTHHDIHHVTHKKTHAPHHATGVIQNSDDSAGSDNDEHYVSDPGQEQGMRDVGVGGKPTGIKALEAREAKMEALAIKEGKKAKHLVHHKKHHHHASKKAAVAVEHSFESDHHHEDHHHEDHHDDHIDEHHHEDHHETVAKAIAAEKKKSAKVIIKKKAADIAAQQAEDKALFAMAEREALKIVTEQFQKKQAQAEKAAEDKIAAASKAVKSGKSSDKILYEKAKEHHALVIAEEKEAAERKLAKEKAAIAAALKAKKAEEKRRAAEKAHNEAIAAAKAAKAKLLAAEAKKIAAEKAHNEAIAAAKAAKKKARDLVLKLDDEIVIKMKKANKDEKDNVIAKTANLKKAIKYILELKEVETALTVEEMSKREEIEKILAIVKKSYEKERIAINQSMQHKLQSIKAIEDGKDDEGKKEKKLSAEALKTANEIHEAVEKERTSIDKALAHEKILEKAHENAEKKRTSIEKSIAGESLGDLDEYLRDAVALITSQDQWRDAIHKLKETDEADLKTYQDDEATAVAVLKRAIANYQHKLLGEVEKRKKIRAFLKDEELKALSILKKHDNDAFDKYKTSVAGDIKAAQDKETHMHDLLTKFSDDQDIKLMHYKQKFDDQIDKNSNDADSTYQHQQDIDQQKFDQISAKLKGEKQRETDLKTIAQLTLAQNNQNYKAQIVQLQQQAGIILQNQQQGAASKLTEIMDQIKDLKIKEAQSKTINHQIIAQLQHGNQEKIAHLKASDADEYNSMVANYKNQVNAMLSDSHAAESSISHQAQHYQDKISHEEAAIDSQQEHYNSVIDGVKHQAEVKIAKLLKELAEEKALVSEEQLHEKEAHAANERIYHDKENALEQSDNVILERVEAKAGRQLTKDEQALKHEKSIVVSSKATEKKVLHDAKHKYNSEVAKISETLEKVVKKALDEKDKYHRVIKHIKGEQKQEHAVDEHEANLDHQREALQKKETMTAVEKAEHEKGLVYKLKKELASDKHHLDSVREIAAKRAAMIASMKAAEKEDMRKIKAQKAAKASAREAENRHHEHEMALDDQRLAEARQEAAADALVRAHKDYLNQLAAQEGYEKERKAEQISIAIASQQKMDAEQAKVQKEKAAKAALALLIKASQQKKLLEEAHAAQVAAQNKLLAAQAALLAKQKAVHAAQVAKELAAQKQIEAAKEAVLAQQKAAHAAKVAEELQLKHQEEQRIREQLRKQNAAHAAQVAKEVAAQKQIEAAKEAVIAKQKAAEAAKVAKELAFKKSEEFKLREQIKKLLAEKAAEHSHDESEKERYIKALMDASMATKNAQQKTNSEKSLVNEYMKEIKVVESQRDKVEKALDTEDHRNSKLVNNEAEIRAAVEKKLAEMKRKDWLADKKRDEKLAEKKQQDQLTDKKREAALKAVDQKALEAAVKRAIEATLQKDIAKDVQNSLVVKQREAKQAALLAVAQKKEVDEHQKLQDAWKLQEAARKAEHAAQVALDNKNKALVNMKTAYLNDANKIKRMNDDEASNVVREEKAKKAAQVVFEHELAAAVKKAAEEATMQAQYRYEKEKRSYIAKLLQKEADQKVQEQAKLDNDKKLMAIDQHTEEKETSEITTARKEAQQDNEQLQAAEQREEQAKQAYKRAETDLDYERSSKSHSDSRRKAEAVALEMARRTAVAQSQKQKETFQTEMFLKNSQFQRQLNEAVKKAAAKAAHDQYMKDHQENSESESEDDSQWNDASSKSDGTAIKLQPKRPNNKKTGRSSNTTKDSLVKQALAMIDQSKTI